MLNCYFPGAQVRELFGMRCRRRVEWTKARVDQLLYERLRGQEHERGRESEDQTRVVYELRRDRAHDLRQAVPARSYVRVNRLHRAADQMTYLLLDLMN